MKLRTQYPNNKNAKINMILINVSESESKAEFAKLESTIFSRIPEHGFQCLIQICKKCDLLDPRTVNGNGFTLGMVAWTNLGGGGVILIGTCRGA